MSVPEVGASGEYGVGGWTGDPAYHERVRPAARDGRLDTLLAWVDLETTGLATEAEILEVALVVTDTELRELAVWRCVRTPTPEGYQQMLDVPFVLDMHTHTRLLAEIGEPVPGGSPDIGWLDHHLATALESVRDSVGHSGTVCYLAGAGVASFDRRLIERDFPRFAKMLHYSAVDMSIVSRAMEFLLGVRLRPGFNPVPHRAMSDVRAAIGLAGRFKEWGRH